MLRSEKERIVVELTERLRSTDSLIVADYRGLTNAELADLRTTLLEHGARFSVVKNTLTRRAAEAAGAEQLLELIDGPTAIAFIESEGDTVAVAKALSDAAGRTRILSLRGAIMAGTPLDEAQLETLAKLPPVDALKGQLLGVIVAPLAVLAALLAAPVQELVGLIDARIARLEEQVEPAHPAEDEPADEAGETDSTETDSNEEE